jgi:hypothetical protein
VGLDARAGRPRPALRPTDVLIATVRSFSKVIPKAVVNDGFPFFSPPLLLVNGVQPVVVVELKSLLHRVENT